MSSQSSSYTFLNLVPWKDNLLEGQMWFGNCKTGYLIIQKYRKWPNATSDIVWQLLCKTERMVAWWLSFSLSYCNRQQHFYYSSELCLTSMSCLVSAFQLIISFFKWGHYIFIPILYKFVLNWSKILGPFKCQPVSIVILPCWVPMVFFFLRLFKSLPLGN